ncbi:MAG: LPS assembly protein LptD [Planctomycetota bacterium]
MILLSMLALASAASPGAEEYRGPYRSVVREQPLPADAILVSASEIVMWREGDVRVFEARGNVELQTPAGELVARQAVFFFEEAYAQQTRRNVLHVYAEGGITVRERARELHLATYYRTYENDAVLLFDDADHEISELPSADLSPLYARATEARAKAIVREPEPPTPLTPGEAVPETPPAEVLSPETLPTRPSAPVKMEPVVVPPPEEGFIQPPDEELRVEVYGTQSAGYEQHVTETADEVVVVLTGGIDVLLAGRAREDFEIVADNVVLWFRKEGEGAGFTSFANLAPKAVYAEGNVVLFRNRMRFEAPRLVHDFELDRSLIYDTVIKTEVAERGIPIYYRASVLKQVSRDLFLGQRGMISNSRSPHPGVYFTTSEFSLENFRTTRATQTPEGPMEEEVVASSIVTAKDNVLYVNDFPIVYWPVFRKDLEDRHFALRRARLSNSSTLGPTLETIWDLNALGAPLIAGTDLSLLLDYFGERGPGVGVSADYLRATFDGSFLGYFLYDHGIDSSGFEPPRSERGRVHWLHRHHLADDTTLDFEVSYLSDAGFLEEYFEREARTEKEQENLVYFKKQRDKWALTLLGKWRLNDFQDQVEYLPQIGFNVVGLSLGDDLFTFHSDTEFANLRNRPSDLFSPGVPSRRILRFDTNNELSLPVSLGALEITPFVEGRVSYFGDTVDDGGQARYAAAYGIRASTRFHRVYEIYSRLLDINRLRHIVVPEITYRNLFTTNLTTEDLFQYDDVDVLSKREVISLGLRQRYQTKRGPRQGTGEAIGAQRIVDLLIVDWTVNLYPRKDRDNNGELADNVQLDSIYELTDNVHILNKLEFNIEKGCAEINTMGVSLTKDPRFRLYFGNRYVRVGDTNAWDISTWYQATPTWDIGWGAQYDFDRRNAVYYQLTLRRFFQAWCVDLIFAYDQGENNAVVAVAFSPRGVPESTFQLRAW